MFTTRSVHDAITERSPAYAILGIDSEDRFRNYDEAAEAGVTTYNASPYDFQITKNESIMNGFFTRLAVTEINFPWMIGNITAATSIMSGTFKDGANPPVDFQIDISTDIGFLRPSEIASIIETLVQAEDASLAGFTMTYGTIPGVTATYPYFVYNTNSTGVTIAFNPLAYSTSFDYPNTQIQLFNVLGFDFLNTQLNETAVSKVTFCQSIRYVDIICSQLTYNQALKDTMSQPIARDTMCRLYIGDGPYTGTSTLAPSDPDYCPPGCAPFTIYRQFTNPKFIRWLPNQPVQGNLRFQVYDDSGVLLSSSDSAEGTGQNWSMTILVSED